MKKKALVLASCVAFATPTISIAQALPDNSVGLNLGDVKASSHLNQPFRGVIPFLFTSVESTRQLSVRLAPQSVFDQIGAEKLPILNDLRFHITSKSNKPVIQISSSTPIQLPFLNFVLEIEGPNGVVYQDYTVLLDPQGHIPKIQTVQQQSLLIEIPDILADSGLNVKNHDTIHGAINNKFINNEVIKNDLPITYSSTSVVTNQPNSHKIKSGDSLTRIARWYKPKNISIKKMMRIIFEKNPKAFIRGDINKIKRGVVLDLPTHKELSGLNTIAKEVEFKGTMPKVADFAVNKGQYKVVKGDNLSKITKKFIDKNTSFTKMMNAIFIANPEAFAKNNKSQLKAGATLRIPSLEEIASPKAEIASIETTANKTTNVNTVAITSEMTSEEPNKIKTEATQTDASKIVKGIKTSAELPLQHLSINSSNQLLADKAKTTTLEIHEYRVKEGDTLTKITKEIGYKNVSFTKMIKAIYSENIHAFEKNNITKLKVGAILTLPKLSEIDGVISNSSSKTNKINNVKTQKPAEENTNKNSTENIEKSIVTKIVETPTKQPIETASGSKEKNTETTAQKSTETVASPISALDTSDLEKRIRELRTELDQAKSGLAEMESILTTKDALIFEKDNQLIDLKSSFIKLKISRSNDEALENEDLAPEDAIIEDELYKETLTSSTPTEIAALKILQRPSEDKSKQGFNHMLSSAVKDYYDNTSPKELAYLSMALILGWLLIRYRRELYSYTSISFDHPKYYPAPGIDEYELKERNISHQEPIREKNSEKEYFEQIKNETKSDTDHAPDNEFGEESQSELINPEPESRVEEAESEEIKHSEHLVTELFSDLNSCASSKTEVAIGDNEWLSIEKICDDYIEKKIETDLDPARENNLEDSEIRYAKEHNDVIEFKDNKSESDVTDFDEMMSDLLKSLDGVEQSIHNNSSLKRNKRHSKIDPTE